MAAVLAGPVDRADPARGHAALTPFEASYRVKIKGLSGEMTMSLNRENQRFVARSVLKAKGIARILARGSVEESAVFDTSGAALTPLSYQSSDTLGGDDEFAAMEFDWASARATGADNDGAFEHAIAAGTFDRVSIQYALMLHLQNGGDPQEYVMLDGSRAKMLDVRNLGESKIRVPLGEFTVTQIQHQARNSSRVTTLWCAEELGFLPVRIEQHRKGKLIVRAEMAGYST